MDVQGDALSRMGLQGRNIALTAELSVVVPLYNEERILPTLHLRLSATLRQMAVPYEIIYVDDGSSDQTSVQVAELCDQEEEVKGIFLTRNFGHQAAPGWRMPPGGRSSRLTAIFRILPN